MTLEVSRTAKPSTVIFTDMENDQFFMASTRTGTSYHNFIKELAESVIGDIVGLDKKAQEVPHAYTPNHYIKLRHLHFDDKNGSFALHVDYIHDEREPPVFSEENIKTMLGDGTVQHHGQVQWVEVRVHKALCSSDYFSPVSDGYYS
jgi:desulfoferrodoxin (superoxide reductase-like protein)